MRRYVILTAGPLQHSVVYLLCAATPVEALCRFLREQDPQLIFRSDGSVERTHEGRTVRYEHPLAYVEAVYRAPGEWQLRELPELAGSSPCTEILCGERQADIDDYVARCRPMFRASHPRSRAKAFVWYLRSGPLVTFYRRVGDLRIDVLGRYLLAREQGPGFVPWEGSYADLLDQLWLGNSASSQ